MEWCELGVEYGLRNEKSETYESRHWSVIDERCERCQMGINERGGARYWVGRFLGSRDCESSH
jgi:hypothetical protein